MQTKIDIQRMSKTAREVEICLEGILYKSPNKTHLILYVIAKKKKGARGESQKVKPRQMVFAGLV